MTTTLAALLGGALGLLLGAAAVLAARWSEGRHVAPSPIGVDATAPGTVADVLAVLRSSGIILDAEERVVNTSPPAVAHGLVRDRQLVHDQLLQLSRQVRRDGEIREAELDLPRGPIGHGRLTVGARVAPLGSEHVLLLVEDLTRAKQVEEVRRDFVENVSHELKTPVGGLALLAEAVLDAHDDPDAVQRFAARMKVESSRLTRLVQEIVDLSRLQTAETVEQPRPVNLHEVATDAVEQTRLLAESRSISVELDHGTVDGHRLPCVVYGDRELLTTAVRNLVTNAVNYSEKDTRVQVSVTRAADLGRVRVTDEGCGIARADLARIFERFYRVDPARSRSTGGTGLGLAIVKHVCANHGGEVTVDSEPGRGSTFTVRLPLAPADALAGRRPAPPGVRTRAVPGIPAGEDVHVEVRP
ncbi:MAG TPA: ATP-binding protein [Segeticoccus sp.]|uniref:sensor histidine kinase n=1 Tax=Segeticoccus sp. TaxID=2706531 RepID=UPI002D7E17FA|nr:ATP-binding protein [Segeticoccus sp.]HET8600130.1 ATP-binding protein [Segeticoccus sp.]